MREKHVYFNRFVPFLVHKLKIRTMRIVTSREFRDNQKKYFDMVDNNEQVIVKRKTVLTNLFRSVKMICLLIFLRNTGVIRMKLVQVVIYFGRINEMWKK